MVVRLPILPFFLVFFPSLLSAQTAFDIVKRAEDLLRGESSKGTFRMTIVTPDYERTMVMDAWWVGTEKALISITSPRREAGNKTLKVGNELWMYLRNTETTIKVPPSMMLQSWNGSDFTNDDLVRESSIARDYTMEILGTDTIEGVAAWKIGLTPKPEAAVVWGRLLEWIRKPDYLPTRAEYYDEKGALVRTMTFTDIRSFHGRRLPAIQTMINNARPGHSTTFEYIDVQFDIPISDRIFSFRELERGRNR